MKIKKATKQIPTTLADLQAQLQATREKLRAASIERAQRIVDNPELAVLPDARDRELVWEIYALQRQRIELEKWERSARGVYFFIGCATGDHKKCRRESKGLVCGCPCHKNAATVKQS